MRRRLFFLALMVWGVPHAWAEVPQRVPEGAARLDAAEIRSLLGSTTFVFEGGAAEGGGVAVSGTSTWDAGSGIAYGTFVWDGKIRGSWNHKWFVKDDQSCLVFSAKRTVCQQIYRHGEGFLEVNEDGTVHTLSLPQQPAALATSLSTDEVQSMMQRMLTWLEVDLQVSVVEDQGGEILITMVHPDGTAAGRFQVDPQTGVLRPASLDVR